jgi:hypothetical protein
MRLIYSSLFVASALVIADPAAATVTQEQGAVFNLAAVSDIYSILYGGPTLGSNGVAFFNAPSPLTYSVTQQGQSLSAGDTITGGEQSFGLQGGLTLDVHALNLTVTSGVATLGNTTTLKNALGASLAGATAHGIQGSMAYTLFDASHTAVYTGNFVFRPEDSDLTMGLATDFDGIMSVFLCGGSGGTFENEPDASGATLDVLDPNSPLEQTIDAATNGLGLELAFGTTDPASVPEPASLPLLGAAIAGLAAARRRGRAGLNVAAA